MTIQDIKNILHAEILWADEEMLSHEVHTACGSDMMSDVLAFVKDQAVLLTGLVNPQVVRTAEMMDMVCIVFVRGKMPDPVHDRLGRAAGNCAAFLRPSGCLLPAALLYENGLRGGCE